MEVNTGFGSFWVDRRDDALHEAIKFSKMEETKTFSKLNEIVTPPNSPVESENESTRYSSLSSPEITGLSSASVNSPVSSFSEDSEFEPAKRLLEDYYTDILCSSVAKYAKECGVTHDTFVRPLMRAAQWAAGHVEFLEQATKLIQPRCKVEKESLEVEDESEGHDIPVSKRLREVRGPLFKSKQVKGKNLSPYSELFISYEPENQDMLRARLACKCPNFKPITLHTCELLPEMCQTTLALPKMKVTAKQLQGRTKRQGMYFLEYQIMRNGQVLDTLRGSLFELWSHGAKDTKVPGEKKRKPSKNSVQKSAPRKPKSRLNSINCLYNKN